jgi:hypothetical protein
MKTDDFVSMLATGVAPVDPDVSGKRFRLALSAGALGALGVMLLAFGLNPHLRAASALPMFWVKLVFPAALAVVAVLLAQRLSHPGMGLGAAAKAWTGPVIAMALLALLVWMDAAPSERPDMIYGRTWKVCSRNIAIVAAPVFAGLLWAMKGLAPTRLVLAGASAGLLAGAVGTIFYALHCPEIAAPFIFVWYGGGMLLCAAIGAVLGPRVLRW